MLPKPTFYQHSSNGFFSGCVVSRKMWKAYLSSLMEGKPNLIERQRILRSILRTFVLFHLSAVLEALIDLNVILCENYNWKKFSPPPLLFGRGRERFLSSRDSDIVRLFSYRVAVLIIHGHTYRNLVDK